VVNTAKVNPAPGVTRALLAEQLAISPDLSGAGVTVEDYVAGLRVDCEVRFIVPGLPAYDGVDDAGACPSLYVHHAFR